MGKTLTLTRSAAVTLAGWNQVSGSHTSPTAFFTLTSVAVPAGPVTITWTVALAGTAGGGDANNFQLYNNGTLLANSVNAGAAGTYPQSAVQAVIPAGGGQFLEVTCGPSNGTAGAVYTGEIDGQVFGTVQLGPSSPGEVWLPSQCSVGCSANVATGTCECNIYAGAAIAQSTFVDGTFSGDTGDTTDAISGKVIQPGQYVFASWSGGVIGATATLVVAGTRTVP